MRMILIFAAVFWVQVSYAKTIMISDIDDTIKIANVPSLVQSARYAMDDESRFTGMSALYNLITQEAPQFAGTYYLSNAPTWLMQATHLDFLENGKFPAGAYLGRTDDEASSHKLKRMREILSREKPDRVILFGDNGENDPLFYSMIQAEFSSQGIEFITFIRLITQAPIQPKQIAFVTPVEVALTLREKKTLTNRATDWLVENVLPTLVTQRTLVDVGVVSFPGYVQCSEFKWNWDKYLQEYPTLQQLKNRITKRCH